MRRAPIVLCAAGLALAGCLIAPPELLDKRSPSRATLLGTLWPPADEPSFVVGGRRITIERAGEPAEEAQTDRRGRFEVRVQKTGLYALTFLADAHRASATVSVVDLNATYRVELITHPL